MMQEMMILMPLPPLLSALLIAGLHFFRVIDGEAGEKTTAILATTAIGLPTLASIMLWLNILFGQMPVDYSMGTWLNIGPLQIDLILSASRFNLAIATLFALLLLIVTRFAVNYLHREPGFHRFFATLSLFSAAMLLLVLAKNAVFTFIGWELAGACSFLLIAYANDRPTATYNATRVFISNRIGDGGFLLAIALSAYWIENLNWSAINQADLETRDATLLACCFVMAACAKSAQVPFSPWLARAMEGPTPSSAVFYGGVMIHAGVFLLIQLQDLFIHAPVAMGFLTCIGALTAVYGYWVGLSQTDIKSSQSLASVSQLGLMFVECGQGFWNVATWHLCAHAIVRCYLLLTAPSILQNTHDNPIKPVPPIVADQRWAFLFSLQRGWLEVAIDWLLIRPWQQLAKDVQYFDRHVVDPLLGSPAPVIRVAAFFAQKEEGKLGANLDSEEDRFAKGSGLAGILAGWTAALLDWFEYRFILGGIGRDAIHIGRRLGHVANRFERLLGKPRFVALFVLITLLVAMGQ